MLKLWKAAASHEDSFIERYERLLAWSLKLTGHDRQLAEDLLHDTFVQFTLSRPDLNSIHDLDGYLFAMLRNSHLSHVRRVPYVRTASVSTAEFDSVEIGLRATDVRDQIKVQDELRLICHYALLRKETSKAGSVLILRFFHGYYPSEIAQLLISNLPAVRKWLQLARNEAKLYLDSPTALAFMRESHSEVKPQIGFASTTEELLTDLRRMIFSSRQGECSSRSQLQQIYRPNESSTIDGQHLAHMVSCRGCLDHVNEILSLPLLQDRYPTDMAGKDTTPKGGAGGGPTGTSGGGERGVRRSLRRVKETFEHYPKELLIAVNGYVQVSQKVSSDRMEQTLSLAIEERIGFVEIFSEQWVRLFFLNINPPPDGAFEQSLCIALSEGRSLEASLDFSGPCPSLQLVYNDPTLVGESVTVSIAEENTCATAASETQAATSSAGSGTFKQTAEQLWRSLHKWSFWLKPSTVTALLAVILIAAVLFFGVRRVQPPGVSVAMLLSESAAAEKTMASRTDQVLHRTISLEEKSSTGALIARRKLEIWQSAERGLTARRLYDERGSLVAGDWRRAGIQTIYHHGSRPQVQSVPGPIAGLGFDNAWQLSPSAEEFTSLIGRPEAVRLEETATSYVITHDGAANDSRGLIKATLVLSRADLRAVEETLSIRQGNEQREYRFVETSYERRPPGAVAPVVFEPDPELLSSSQPEIRNPKLETVDSATGPQPFAPTLATPELEVEAWRLLNQAGADTGEQISVARTSEGQLKIDGLVDTEMRKGELLRALSPIAKQSAVRINILTVAEAVAKERRSQPQQTKPGQVTIQRVETSSEEFPVKQQLRGHFGSDEEARRFAAQTISRSRRAMSHAAALKRLVSQFSASELRALVPDARAKWLDLVRSHARAFQQETAALRQELSPIFFPGGVAGGPSGPVITDDSELVQAVFKLFEIGAANDGALRSAFSVSTDGSVSPVSVSQTLQASLKRAEEQAARIQAVK